MATDKEKSNLVGIEGYEMFDLNDPNFMAFIKRLMEREGLTQVEAIEKFVGDMRKTREGKPFRKGGIVRGSGSAKRGTKKVRVL